MKQVGFITDILPSDAARPRGQYISYKPPSRFITLTYKMYMRGTRTNN